MDKTFLVIILVISSMVVSPQYTDDSDYDEFPIYEDSNDGILESQRPDDFYIIPEDDVNDKKVEMSPREHKVQEKKYQYTKHRIPGYDYDELDFMDEGSVKRCDERSVWTHCLCQFTCISKNTVDCYTPCGSGCECKEDFVFDEESGTCVYPDQCLDLIRI
ncbi:uncharacterized protein LOC135169919 [Diachasmimorpha longicaudata]|uniref:uncharacterized protein LOC135169919 n=1 Tax=Diachasmimorpha longicaudata TaxID=58733 RepID=UPI0030B8F0BD